ncbi:MAG: helix-turn-helix transcriptional regulator [Deltaproteobacteria bacterium]|nr:helix-turn-helix transcriptional regulator [Deltaproteobacteria bacterium]
MKRLVRKKTTTQIDDLDKRFRTVAYFPQTDTFQVSFLDGRAYHLPRVAFASDLEFNSASPVTAVSIGADLDYYFTIHFASGTMFDVPWDRVLHECEPAYDYFKGHHLKQGRADLASEAQQVRRLRQQAGLTQETLAKRAGIARPNLARVESGRYRPSLETLERIARALGQPLSTLIVPPPILAQAGQPKHRRKARAA